MSAIRIERLSDWHDCETCGSSYAEGAKIWIDGEPVLELIPLAHCYDGASYGDGDIMRAILEHLGHTVTEDGSVG